MVPQPAVVQQIAYVTGTPEITIQDYVVIRAYYSQASDFRI
jgi:hypothetical protein